MNNSKARPFAGSTRLFVMAALVLTLTLGTGQTARAAGTLAAQAPVNLGMAGIFTVLSQSGITNVPTSHITGNMGVSPIAAAAITGFGLVKDASGRFSRSTQVIGRIYAANYTSPTPSMLTTAISNMHTAYTNAAGRPNPNHVNLGAGNIGGRTLTPGLYKWGTSVVAFSNFTLSGGPTAVWIFQISGNLTLGSGVRMILSGGALAKNIFWQVAGGSGITLGTTAHGEGIALAKTAIHLRTGASWHGRLLAQTAVTLDHNVVGGHN